MIDEKRTRKYCREDISLIENYDKAIKDEIQTWCCHHRDEVKNLPSGIKVIRSMEELKENGRYYNCPANELIFLTKKEHNTLHKHRDESKRKISEAHKGRKLDEETRKKISEAHKGKCKVKSEFGKKFKEHFGINFYENTKLYNKEYYWYRKYHKCSWE